MLKRIESPNKGYNGTSANIRFKVGVAIAEVSQSQYLYFSKKGYKISDVEEINKSDVKVEEVVSNVVEDFSIDNLEDIDMNQKNIDMSTDNNSLQDNELDDFMNI